MYIRKSGVKHEVHDLHTALIEKSNKNEGDEHKEKTESEENVLKSDDSLRTDTLFSESSSSSESNTSSKDSESSESKTSSDHSQQKKSVHKKKKSTEVKEVKSLDEKKIKQEEEIKKKTESFKEEQVIFKDKIEKIKEEEEDEEEMENIEETNKFSHYSINEVESPSGPKIFKRGKKQSYDYNILSIIKNLLISANLLFFLARIFLFFWIFYYKSASGILILFYLFYSIMELDNDRLVRMTRIILIPILLIITLATYMLYTLSISTPEIYGLYYKSYPSFEFVYQITTVFSFLFINRYLGYKKKIIEITTETKTTWGIIYTIIQQNSDKISLMVLFLVGLSGISIIHIGFVIICLVFFFDTRLAKKFWKWLMMYTMIILLVRYIWLLIIPLIHIQDQEILIFIGLPDKKTVDSENWQILPYDYSIWILLVFANIQYRAYGSTMFSIDYYRLTKADFRANHKRIVDLIVKVFEFYSIFQVWVSYFFIFLIILISPLNIMNFIRFACFCLFMMLHLYNVSYEISFNYLKVKKLWGITVYYSGILLIIRYLYQFIPFLHLSFDTQFELIGFQVYPDSVFYWNMVEDCFLFLFSILESRNRQELIDIDSFDFEDVGFLTGIIKANSSLIGQERHVTTTLQFIEEPFPLIVLFVIALLSIFWRLSLSMLFLLGALGIYLLVLGVFFGEVVEHKQLYSAEREWELRVTLWKALFIITFFSFLLSYSEFFVSSSIFNRNTYINLLWFYFVIGFSKSEGSYLISVNYGYVIIWIFLIIERHCIEFMLKTRVNISQEDEFRRLKNKNLTLMKVLDFLRIFAESLVPMFVLLIAFNKLTFVSIIYVFAVFFCLFASPYKRTHILNIVVIFMIWLQYVLILSNIQVANSPSALPTDRKLTNTPWYTRIHWITSDDPVFLNLGTDINQLSSIFYDLLCSMFIMIYYKFLCTKEHELLLLEIANPENDSTTDKSVSKFTIFKNFVYDIAHFVIFLVVLLFIIQNKGLISGVYCLFCLIFIYGANEVIRSEWGWNKYLRILRYFFLNFMLLDLALNIIIQIPFGIMDISNNGWLVAVGAERMWRAGQSSPPPDEAALHTKVACKILAFAFLYMMYRMMRSKDFNMHMTEVRQQLEAQGKFIGYSLAKEFNNKRIEENVFYQDQRGKFESEIKKLDQNVQKWNRKFYEEKRDRESFSASRTRGLTVKHKPFAIAEQKVPDNEPTMKSRFQNWLISLLNPVIFHSYLEELKTKEKVISTNVEEIDVDEKDFELKNIQENKEDFEEIDIQKKKAITEYNFTWKNYLKLIFVILRSNTQGLVFLFCIINHIVYASFESLFFPISVIGYAMLEYPRPPIRYFKYIMLYAELVFFIKFTLQFQIWDFIFGKEFLEGYQDPYKFGFNIASNTYSSTLVNYVILDIMVMLTVLIHEHVLLRVGLWHNTEYEMETLQQARERLQGKNASFTRRDSDDSDEDESCHKRISRKITDFFHRLLPKNKEEKPGKDLYTPINLIQLVILVYLFLFFSTMDGKNLDISKSIK